VLYGLRNQYGASIVVYQLIDAETDYTTGVKTIDKISYELTAVVTPTKLAREVLQSISQISANKTMVYGGTFDSGVKTFAIEGRHLPNDFEFNMDDWIVYNNQRFEIKSIEKLDHGAGWIIVGRVIVGQHAERIFHENASNILCNLDSYAEVVPWSTHHPEHNIPLDHDVAVQKVMYRSAENTLSLAQSASLGVSQIYAAQNDLILDQSATAQKILYRSAISTDLVFNTLGVGVEIVKVIN